MTGKLESGKVLDNHFREAGYTDEQIKQINSIMSGKTKQPEIETVTVNGEEIHGVPKNKAKIVSNLFLEQLESKITTPTHFDKHYGRKVRSIIFKKKDNGSDIFYNWTNIYFNEDGETTLTLSLLIPINDKIVESLTTKYPAKSVIELSIEEDGVSVLSKFLESYGKTWLIDSKSISCCRDDFTEISYYLKAVKW